MTYANKIYNNPYVMERITAYTLDNDVREHKYYKNNIIL